RQIDCFYFHALARVQRRGREVQHGLDSRRHDLVENSLRRLRGHSDHHHVDRLVANHLSHVLNVMDENARLADPFADLLPVVVEDCGNHEIRLFEAVVIRQRRAQPAGAENAYTMRTIETKYFSNVGAQICNVVTDAAHAKLTEVTEVLTNLRRV